MSSAYFAQVDAVRLLAVAASVPYESLYTDQVKPTFTTNIARLWYVIDEDGATIGRVLEIDQD